MPIVSPQLESCGSDLTGSSLHFFVCLFVKQGLTVQSRLALTHYVSQACLELMAIFLTQSPESWDYRQMMPHPVAALILNMRYLATVISFSRKVSQ